VRSNTGAPFRITGTKSGAETSSAGKSIRFIMRTGSGCQVDRRLIPADMRVLPMGKPRLVRRAAKETRMPASRISLRNPMLIMAVIGLSGPAMSPALAQQNGNQAQSQPQSLPTLYEYDGKSYQTLEQCLRAKKRAKARGAIAGAVIAGAGAALLGGNVGESALVAGAGALAGREIGRATAKRC
jgi:hypothetical protein